MEETNKSKCFRCRYFTAYYTKGNMRFNRTKNGGCTLHDKTVGNMETCVRFKDGSSWYSRKSSCKRVLYDLLFQISQIRQILQEEENENENL